MANEAVLPFPGQNAARQEDEQEQKERKNPTDIATKARDAAKKAKGIANNAKRVADAAQKARAAVQAAAAAANPWVIAILLAIVGIILIYIFFFSHGSALDDNSNDTAIPTSPGGGVIPPKGIPGLSITMTGPQVVNNGEDIEYTISYTYDATLGKVPLESIVLFDTVPQNASFVSTSGVQAADSTPTLVTWSLQDPANQKTFKIILHPTADDTYVNNVVSARLAAGAGTGSATGDPPDFLALIVGQGRNTGVLGDKNTFVSTIITNASGLSLTGKESYLGQIYDAGIQYNVNPLILAVVWGTESGFDTAATYPFGCLNPADAGFTENVTCAAGSLNQLMSKFETQNMGGALEIPSSIGNTCIYTDAFVYAYEMYAPICHANDGNDAARTNFTSFYKKFKGI